MTPRPPRRGILILALILFLPLLHTPRLVAGDDRAKPRVQRLTLFKNGLAFIVSGITLPDDARTVKIGPLPVPSFGSFWVAYPEGVNVQSLLTSMEDVERVVPAQTVGQLVEANAGRHITVHTADRDFEGTVMPPAAAAGSPLAPDPYFMSPRTPDPFPSDLRPYVRAGLLSIKSDRGIVVLDPGSVVRAEFTDHDPVMTVTYRVKSPSLRIELGKPAGGKKITVSCLVHGVTWVPAYLIDLSDPTTARFSAHAEIMNEIADFDDVKVQLVTGFPNLRFADIQSPVGMSQSLSDFLRSLSGSGGSGGGGRSMLMNQVALTGNSRSDAEMSAVVPGYSAAVEGQTAEDLFFYPVQDCTLRKDETAWIPLFSAAMPYRHVYTWKIRDFLDENDHYRSDAGGPEGGGGEEVWHSCRLTNTLSMPLTTSSVEFITDGEFTGQDVCYYTAPKTETTIRINKALNILADQAESEVERKRDVAVIHGYHYDLVKIQGDLGIRNRVDRTVSVEITKELSGEVLETLPRAADVKSAKGLRAVNTKHILTWTVELAPGAEQKVSYQYQVYFRD